jgi:hypothetical protein
MKAYSPHKLAIACEPMVKDPMEKPESYLKIVK